MKKRDSLRGFTIIEVALVLALAGLIFLMVFIVLPSVQKTQRDAERRDDMGTLIKAISDFKTNSRGSLPTGDGIVTWEDAKDLEPGDTTWAGMYKSYLGENFSDPNGANFHYVLEIGDCGAKNDGGDVPNRCSIDNMDERDFKENEYKVLVVRRATCDGSYAVVSNNSRKVAVVYKLEGAGSYCVSTQ